ncbi:MAG: hypothetical protein IKT70_02910 [Clostridia bacterium]|nr:hypothetical protein [Clostridia bacterium]
MIDQKIFAQICDDTIHNPKCITNIGTYNEKIMHLILKKYIDPDESHHEKKCCGFFADILDGNNITEIQTGSLSPLKKKLLKLSDLGYNINVVHPIYRKKWISWLDTNSGEITRKRLSPKKGSKYHFLAELVYVLPLLKVGNIKFTVLFLEVEEYRNLNGWDSTKKKGSTKNVSIPISLLDEMCISSAEDYHFLIPKELNETFSTAEFAKAAGLTKRRAYAAIRVLKEVMAIEPNHTLKREIYYKKTFVSQSSDTSKGE